MSCLMSHETHKYVLVFQVHTRDELILIVILEFLNSTSNHSLVDQKVKKLPGEGEVVPVPCGVTQAF